MYSRMDCCCSISHPHIQKVMHTVPSPHPPQPSPPIHTHTQQMVSLYRDPEGEKVFSKSVGSQSPHVTGVEKRQLSIDDQTVASLQKRVKELEVALSKYENTQTLSTVEPMTKNTSKVSFSLDMNGQTETYNNMPSKGAVKNKTADNGDEYATSEL